jgi:enoyl-CoA hydratase/carnithine racemase
MATLRELASETTANNDGSVEKVQFTTVENGTIGIIVLNDPGLGNPMSPDMGDQFHAIVGRTKTLKSLRAVIVRGAGNHFSVGGHREMLTGLAETSMTETARHDFMLGFYDKWLSLLEIPVPVIAAIEGDCIGVAPIFACASDICIADETANFQITFAGLGLYPGMGMSYILPKLVGAQQTALLMVAGAPFSGKEAFGAGLVARSASKGTVHNEALKIAQQIAANEPTVVRPLTQALRLKRVELKPALESDATRQAVSYATAEFRKHIAEYLPKWYAK